MEYWQQIKLKVDKMCGLNTRFSLRVLSACPLPEVLVLCPILHLLQSPHQEPILPSFDPCYLVPCLFMTPLHEHAAKGFRRSSCWTWAVWSWLQCSHVRWSMVRWNWIGLDLEFLLYEFDLVWVERESELSKYGVKKAAVICQSIELSINSNILCLQIGELVWQFGNDISFNTFSCMSVKNCAIEDKT